MTRVLPELYILRHGETLWNREARMQGSIESPLSDTGHAQAKAMAEVLRARGITPDTHDLWVSPKGRAIETARYIAQATGCAPIVTPELREISVGDWVGLSRKQILSRWPAPVPNEHFVDFYARAPGGDSFEAFWDRMGQVLAKLTRPTVIVTHGMTSRFLRTRALGRSLADLKELEGGQGCIFHLVDGVHSKLGTSIGEEI